MSLTCIGRARDGTVDVVWVFHGPDAEAMLGSVSNAQLVFDPVLRLKYGRSNNAFTCAYTQPAFRYNVGQTDGEKSRLLSRKVSIVRQSSGHCRHPADFFDEDD